MGLKASVFRVIIHDLATKVGGVAIEAAASAILDWFGGEISETRRHKYPQSSQLIVGSFSSVG